MMIRNPSWPREKVGPAVLRVKFGTINPNTTSETITLR
jgi:hypothetical protein